MIALFQLLELIKMINNAIIRIFEFLKYLDTNKNRLKSMQYCELSPFLRFN